MIARRVLERTPSSKVAIGGHAGSFASYTRRTRMFPSARAGAAPSSVTHAAEPSHAPFIASGDYTCTRAAVKRAASARREHVCEARRRAHVRALRPGDTVPLPGIAVSREPLGLVAVESTEEEDLSLVEHHLSLLPAVGMRVG